MFDRWDHTIQTGNDSEYSLLVLALCVGLAYSFARFIVKSPAARRTAKLAFTYCVQLSFLLTHSSFNSLFKAIASPPLELRI
jgi:ABC-type spermidine/putrescine transport system permease subunit I